MFGINRDRPAGRQDDRFNYRWVLILLALVILGAAAIRVRLLQVPLERDEGEYAYAGQLFLQGVPPYKLAYSMKLPGTSFAYAVSMSLFGQTIAGIRLGLLLVNAGTTLLLFFLGRRMLGPLPALATAAAFASLSLSTEMLGIFAHATHFVLLPATAGLLGLLAAVDSGRVAMFFLSGLCFGLAVLMKQPGAVFPLFALSWLAWTRFAAHRRESRQLLREGIALSVGTIVPLAATATALAFLGVFDKFWFWTVQYAGEYGTALPLSEGFVLLRDAASRIVPPSIFLFGLSALGLIMLLWPRSGNRHRLFLVAFLVFSFIGVSPGLYFREHYFILLLPAISLLVGAAFDETEYIVSRTGPRRAMPLVLLVVGTLACAQSVYAQMELYFQMSPERVSRSLYGINPFAESVEIGRYIQNHTRPDDRVAVFGSEPQIFFYSGRRSATGHIYMYGLMERHPFARRMQEEMIREIEASRPAYVIWVKVPTSWLELRDSERLIFDWAGPYISAKYEIVGHLVHVGTEQTKFFWDAAATAVPLGEASMVLVLRRKDFVGRLIGDVSTVLVP
jgi:4-amino-4-deoxy-L-arabinose transferase-like glycosyltransferase